MIYCEAIIRVLDSNKLPISGDVTEIPVTELIISVLINEKIIRGPTAYPSSDIVNEISVEAPSRRNMVLSMNDAIIHKQIKKHNDEIINNGRNNVSLMAPKRSGSPANM